MKNQIIKLNQNENPLGPGPMVMATLHEEMAQVSLYPTADGEPLSQALAEHYDLPSERIILSNGSGSISILLLIAQQLTAQGGSVMFSGQGYISFLFRNLKASGILDSPFTIIPKNEHRHDLAAMAKQVMTTDARVIFIENPDNPTGTWISHDLLADFLMHIPEHVIVVVDEAYSEYARYMLGADYPDTISLQKKHSNLMTVRTFSKAYGLAGLRIGYAISSTEIRGMLNKKRVKLCITSPALAAACVALKDKDHLKLTLETNSASMKYLENSFEEMHIDYISSAANFIMFSAGDNTHSLFEKLKQRNILIFPLVAYELPSKLRVTLGLAEENKAFIKNLREILPGL